LCIPQDGQVTRLSLDRISRSRTGKGNAQAVDDVLGIGPEHFVDIADGMGLAHLRRGQSRSRRMTDLHDFVAPAKHTRVGDRR
jgi:hypothetical protein